MYHNQPSPSQFVDDPSSPSLQSSTIAGKVSGSNKKIFKNQIKALVIKNYRLQSRQIFTNICQIITPLACLYFGVMLSKIWSADPSGETFNFPMLHNVPYNILYNHTFSPILLTTCLQWYLYDFENATQATKDFIYNKDKHEEDFLSSIAQFNCPQYNTKVPFFERPKEGMTINEELAEDYRKMNEYPFFLEEDNKIAEIMPDGALTFYEANPQKLSYRVQISDNQLNEYRRNNGVTKLKVKDGGGTYVVPRVFDGMLGLIDLVSRTYIQKTNKDIFLLSGVMRMPFMQDTSRYLQKAITLTGTFLFPVALSLLLPVILSSLVLEKEEGIRGMMKMNGLKMRNYWLVHYIWSLLFYYLVVAVFWGMGYFQANIPFFTDTSPLILLAAFGGWGHCQIGMAFILQWTMQKSRTAAIVGYMAGTVLIFCGVCINTGVYIAPSEIPLLLKCIPPLAFARILYLLAATCGSDSCLQSFFQIKGEMAQCFVSMYIAAFIFPIIAMYLEGENINPYHLLRYGFKLCFGTPNKDKLTSYQGMVDDVVMDQGDGNNEEDGDCKVVREFAESVNSNLDQYALVCKGLKKVYKSYDSRPPKEAVKDFSLVIPKGELFGLLGPNGAGKTSLISLLAGLSEPTKGNAWVSGSNIMSQTEDANAKMGVCPQDNYLWPDLTVKEHLEFYAKLKGIPTHLQDSHVKRAISDVALQKFTNFEAKSLSGGMQRRLSVAISLVGDPDIVFLDEPTTGLDPENRRGLWDILANLRGEKAMILTTHSMEEADVLCNRIGIFKDGGLRCIGPQTRLKKLYGDGYYLNINCFRDMDSFLKSKQKSDESPKPHWEEEHPSPLTQQPQVSVKVHGTGYDNTSSVTVNRMLDEHNDDIVVYYDKLQAFIKEMLPHSELRSAFNGNFCFQVPSEGLKVSRIFRLLNAHKEELAIKDWGMSQSSLEEVFLKIANDEMNVVDIMS